MFHLLAMIYQGCLMGLLHTAYISFAANLLIIVLQVFLRFAVLFSDKLMTSQLPLFCRHIIPTTGHGGV